MNLQPVLVAVIVVDVLAVTTLILAMAGAIRVALGWDRSAASRGQLLLERVAEQSSTFGRFALGLHALAGMLFIVALNHVLPSIVPGAMCGVGALQAMPGGSVALAVRGLALVALWVWTVLDALDRSAPTAPLATVAARALLVAGPVALVAAWQNAKALLSINVQHPVSCCAAVYDLASEGAKAGGELPTAGLGHVLVALGIGTTVVVLALWIRRSSIRGLASPTQGVGLAVMVLVWTGLAGWTLVDVAGPYHYRALGHRCPLCVFLPHHGAVGYALYGALAGVIAESLTVATATVAGSRIRELTEQARLTARRAALGMVLSLVVFVLLAAGPAIVWRLRFGVWIEG